MRILTLAVLIAGFATLIAVPAGLQAQEPPKNIVITPYITSPLEGDPSRAVHLTTVLVPAGGATPFHRHPGDQWEMVQEGEITYTVKGEEPKVLKAAMRSTFRAAPFIATRTSAASLSAPLN